MSYDGEQGVSASGWLSALRLFALAVTAHFVPGPAELHVAPAPQAVLGRIVEDPTARRIPAGLEPSPSALGLCAEDLREQQGHDTVGRTVPGRGPQRRASVRTELHPQGGGGGELVQTLHASFRFARTVVCLQQHPQSLPEIDQYPSPHLADALAHLQQSALGE